MIADRCSIANETDEALMERVVTGDPHAFELIYDRHHRQAFGVARRILGRSGGAEEATQDAFMALWRRASGYDPARGRLAPWLLTLVRNRSIDLMRRNAPNRGLYLLDETAAERVESPERTDEQVFARQERERARRMLADLPLEQREVLDLAYFSGYTQPEIAARVGVPIGTVKGRTRLGLEKLRRAAESEPALQPAA